MEIYCNNNTTEIYKKNGITFVYQPNSICFGCVIKVNKGLYNNPQSGLAHLLEHCVFEQTNENKSFFDIINKYDGSYNGLTSSYLTLYEFNIKNPPIDVFINSLYLFIDMVTNVTSLNYPDKIDGVINIVNEEISLMKQNQIMNLFKILYLTDNVYLDSINPSNDFNKDTISILKSFHKKYYNNLDILVYYGGDYTLKIDNIIPNINKNIIKDDIPKVQTGIIKYISCFPSDFCKIYFLIKYDEKIFSIIEYFIYIFKLYLYKHANDIFLNIKYSISNVIELVIEFNTSDYIKVIEIYTIIYNTIFEFNDESYKYYCIKLMIHEYNSLSLLSADFNITNDITTITDAFKYDLPIFPKIMYPDAHKIWDNTIKQLNIVNSQIIVNSVKNKTHKLKYDNIDYDILNINNFIPKDKSLIKLDIINLKSPNFNLLKKEKMNEFTLKFEFNKLNNDYSRYLTFQDKITQYFFYKYSGKIIKWDYGYNNLYITIQDYENNQLLNIKKILYYIFEYKYSKDEIQKYKNIAIDNKNILLENNISSYKFIINTVYYNITIFDIKKENIYPGIFKIFNQLCDIKWSKSTLDDVKNLLIKHTINKINVKKKYYTNLKPNLRFPINKIFYTPGSNIVLVKQIPQKLLYPHNDIYHRLYRYIISKLLDTVFFKIFRTIKQYTYTAKITNKIFSERDITYYLMNFIIILNENKFNLEKIASEINVFIYETAYIILSSIDQRIIDVYFNKFKNKCLNKVYNNNIITPYLDDNLLNNIKYVYKNELLEYYLKYIIYNIISVNTFIVQHKNVLNKTF